MPRRRQIVIIDEDKCDGCGLCVIACAEGAIQIIEGKARLVSEKYCDGLGACLGECPQGALMIEEREAEEFSEAAVERPFGATLRVTPPVQDPEKRDPSGSLFEGQGRPNGRHLGQMAGSASAAQTPSHAFVCPGAAARMIPRREAGEPMADGAEGASSMLGNWPVQLRLVPVQAPYFEGARLLIAADCVPFSFADFHRQCLAGRVLLVGCPKLDETELYRRKLAAIFAQNQIESIDVAYMEVPCCFGLVHIVREALEESGKSIPATLTKFAIAGGICETSDLAASVL